MAYSVNLVAVHITRACSHRCPFCYASSAPRVEHPPYSKLLEVIRAIASNGVKDIVFLGGDPCEYPNLLDVCAEVKQLGLSTTVLSNTHKYPMGQLTRAIDVIDCMETTFHGPNAIVHDSIAMADGAFGDVVGNLRLLEGCRSLGIVYNITPQNCRLLYETVSELIQIHGLPFDHLLLQRIIPQGRGRTTTKFTVGKSHVLSALADVEKIAGEFGIKVFFEDPVPFCAVPERFHKYLSRCEWGFTRAAVDSKGNLSRCGADPRYRLGNILETPLQEIWNTSPILKSFRERDYLPEKCLSCALLEKCGGGCALSCEIERDHGPDHIFFEQTKAQVRHDTTFTFRTAEWDDLSDILRIEWACFPDYEFKFSPSVLMKWFTYNPAMFYVLEEETGDILGYACLVPLSAAGFAKVKNGEVSTIFELQEEDVIQKGKPFDIFWHVEVLASISDMRSRAGLSLVRNIGEFLANKGKVISASPITDVGVKLCRYFNFQKVATETTRSATYDIYVQELESKNLSTKLGRF